VLARLKKKKTAFEQYKQSREGQDYLAYAKARNNAKTETRRAVREFEKEIALQAKKNPKAFYKYVNSKVKTRSCITTLTSDKGEILSDDGQKAEAFNDLFASVFTREDLLTVPTVDIKNPSSVLSSIVISEVNVQKILKNLRPDKSPGPDNIHPRILKECANELAGPLATLFRSTMEQSQLPREWKDAHVTPVYKNGTRTSANNYRPISLTSVCCKVLEKLIRDAVLDHMLQNKFLSDKQHGFVHGRSCTTQLLKVIDLWTEILDQGGAIDSVYLDFAKAFDTVPHERLLVKLASYGISGQVLHWIRHFLTGRRQRVAVAGAFSTWIEVLSGVPQGSVLGPILFVCFINDMPDVVESFVYMYADDSKIFRKVDFIYEAESLQRDLDSLQEWECKWQLRFNVNKCKVMHFGGSRNSHVKYFMKGSALQETTEEKDLGIWINNDLKFSTHVAKAVSKANQILGLIRRSFTHIDCQLMKLLFTALVRPHLEYGNVIWHPFLQKDIQMLEKVQHRATRMVPGLAKMQYEDRLKLMNLPSLAYRRLRGDAIEVFKYMHGVYNVDCTQILPRHKAFGPITRGHSMKLEKRDCKGRLRANVLGYRIVNFWNSLPEDVVSAESVNCFKGRFDRLIGSRCFSEDLEDVFRQTTSRLLADPSSHT